MITVFPLKDKAAIEEAFGKYQFGFNENSGIVRATYGDEVLGQCLYYLDDKGITILSLEPEDDEMLADGILRSALHVAAEHSAMDARYALSAPKTLLDKLGFIKSEEDKTLLIDKLFGGCCCGK